MLGKNENSSFLKISYSSLLFLSCAKYCYDNNYFFSPRKFQDSFNLPVLLNSLLHFPFF